VVADGALRTWTRRTAEVMRRIPTPADKAAPLSRTDSKFAEGPKLSADPSILCGGGSHAIDIWMAPGPAKGDST
jgi:hypothetical protein